MVRADPPPRPTRRASKRVAASRRRTAQALGAQSEQLPRIGAHLEEVAAALAEAQKGGNATIATLEISLHELDDLSA